MTSSNQAIATSHTTPSIPLESALLEAQQLLASFAQENGFDAEYLTPAFGTTLDLERLQDLREQFAQGDFSALPAIASRSSQELNGALGVYVSETNQIYLSDSFLLHGTQDQIVAVVLEEIGHGLDAQLNATDSAGDEGAIFSALVRGQNLSEAQLAALHAENDQATLLLDDQWVTVEQASLTVNIAAQNVVDGDTTSISTLLASPGADGLISLREAIAAANNTAGADTITFDQSGTILLDAIDNATDGNNATPALTDDLLINGDLDNDGIPDVTLDASPDQNKRVFHVVQGATVAVDGLVITGGNADAGGSGDDGGAIFNKGTLTVINAVITGNSASDDGGGIATFNNTANAAGTNVINSTLSGNTAGGNGGALSNTTFTSAAANSTVMTVTNSTISGNMANVGGGIASLGQNADNSAVVNVVNSTISGNTVVFGGGGIYNRGQTATLGSTINITSSTITQNTVTNPGSSAGGILNLNFMGGANTARVTVSNSIIAGNTATVHPDVRRASATNSPVVDEGNNVIGADSQGLFTTSTLVGTVDTPLDPGLGDLADNGGLTQTHLPLSNSPVLNVGSDAIATTASLTTDQRGTGFDRLVGVVDIGAVERQASTVSILVSDASADENTPGDTATYRISRTREIDEDLTVELGLTLGTDLSFSDFTLSGGNIAVNSTANTATLTIPTNQFFVDLIFTATDDTITEAAESLTLALVNTNNFTIDSSNNSATATIIANDPVVTPTPTPTPALTPTPTPTPSSPPDRIAPIGTIAPLAIPIRTTIVSEVQITFDEAVTNFDLSDVQLTRDGVVIELTGVTLTTTNSVNWTLVGLSALTTEDGTYVVTLTDTTDVTDTSGNALTSNPTVTWQTGQTGVGRSDIDFSGGNEGRNARGSNQGERIIGTPSNDVLRGGGGNDRIIAGFGQQLFGRDRLFGEGGNDVMKAGAGKDFLDGGAGRDRLFGGRNDDELLGGNGNDRLNGDRGDDLLNGGLGRDRINPGQGRDTIIYSALDEGVDTIIGFNSNQDFIDLSGIFSASEYAADNSFAQFINYVQLEQIGSATHVKVDADGSGIGTDFTTLAKLRNTEVDTISSRNFVIE